VYEIILSKRVEKFLDKLSSKDRERINWRADLSKSKRVEIPEIPFRALKEALVNSFCHRDYTAPESNKIAIYRNLSG
jgi:ATP-dependent DNA helicase RecG